MSKDPNRFKVNPSGLKANEIDVEQEDISPSRPARPGEIPVIDVSCLWTNDKKAIASVAMEVRDACERIGFFYIVNHGVDNQIIDNAFSESKRFFDQPQEFKQQLEFDKNDRGYKGFGTIAIPGYVPDLKEVLDLGIDYPLDHPDVIAEKPLHGPNQWPALPGFKETLNEYYDAIRGLGYELLRLFALALELEEDYFQSFHKEPMITWRIMRYFPLNDKLGQYGTAPHTDFGTITLLTQDSLGGLEVYSKDGEWIQAPFIEDSIVVNIGDLMACWTNDVFTSTPHRVINNSGQNRYSIPMFYNPAYDTVAECLPSCCDESNPPKHEPIHYGNYVKDIYGRIFSKPPES